MDDPVEEISIHKALRLVQAELKAPKSQHNSFGNYDYRNAEDILEAAKPICLKHGLTPTIDDDIVLIGERYYVKATAIVTNDEGESITASALAREAEDKKGMDSAQVTGATSSYARKYALNGLFAIDDSKDADTDEHKHTSDNRTSTTSNPAPKASANKRATDAQLNLIRGLAKRKGKDNEWYVATLDKIRSAADASAVIDKLNDLEDAQ